MGTPQSDDFGVAFGGAFAGDYPLLSSLIAVEGDVGMLALTPKSAVPAGEAKRSVGTVPFFLAGVRIRPLVSQGPGGLWLGGGVGLVFSGSNARFGAGAHAGYDLLLGDGSVGVGPFVAYTHVLEPGTSLARDNDAHIVWGGVEVSFGSPRKRVTDESPSTPAAVGDADGDGIGDSEDACPSVKGIRTGDINTNGCPEDDIDGDGVPNAEDACPQSKGERTQNPKTNGCPPIQKTPDDDRDGDTIPSSVDACPDEAGQPSDDPAKNGCPAPMKKPGDVDELDN